MTMVTIGDFRDSTNKPIHVGDRVRWRGVEYTINGFVPGEGAFGTAVIEFEEPLHLPLERPDESSVDVVS